MEGGKAEHRPRDIMILISNRIREGMKGCAKKGERMHGNKNRCSPQRHIYSPNETVLLNAGLPMPDQATGGEC